MSYSPVLGDPKPQYEDSNGAPYVGMRLFFYQAGTSTKQNTQTDSTGAVNNTNPVVFGADGFPESDAMIYGANGTAYKVVAAPPGSDDPPTSPLWTIDNIYAGGSGGDAWGIPYSVTRTDADTVTYTGADITDVFHVGRRVWCSDADNSANDVYGVVKSVSFSTDTTIDIMVDNGGSINAATDTLYPAINRADTKGAGLNYYPTLASETVGNIENWDYEWGNVLRYIPRNLHAGIISGTNTTDLSTYFNSAISECNGILYIPEGVYLITSTLSFIKTGFDTGIIIRGTTTTRLEFNPTSVDNLFEFNEGGGNNSGIIVLEGFSIKDITGTSSFGVYGIKCDSLNNLTIRDVSIEGFQTGIYCEDSYSCVLERVRFKDCINKGFHYLNTSAGGGPTLYHCRFSGCGLFEADGVTFNTNGYAMYFDTCNCVNIIGGVCADSSKGIGFDTCRPIRIDGLFIEKNLTSETVLQHFHFVGILNDNVTVQNCLIGQSDTATTFENITGLAFKNNRIINSTVNIDEDTVLDIEYFANTTGTGGVLEYDENFSSYRDVPITWTSAADGTISGATQTNPVVITETAHGRTDGDVIYIQNVGGMTEINGYAYTIANSTTNTYELSGVDGTGFTAYTTGGTATSCYDIKRFHTNRTFNNESAVNDAYFAPPLLAASNTGINFRFVRNDAADAIVLVLRYEASADAYRNAGGTGTTLTLATNGGAVRVQGVSAAVWDVVEVNAGTVTIA